ncbi:LacI family transcriptional regulator [Rubrivivax gelatinosus]|uniref:Bug family tripartite tricarboxylate transporter substrate binding protein n=1 Tax=Rubrivivax gelatinosus TaxID=28068 RepID=UPI00190597CB|nr:tripartite tricarboxylate transporter substrate binding protein [Rubrivivax gelatinosus]MBK1616513.1 LacI family transcriptional regulator [Rubrivivax gelatinosus]
MSRPDHPRRRLLVAAAGCALAAPLAAWAQAYPNHPLRLVVPFPPGGPTDIVARPLARQLGDALGQSVVVDNRGGAGGSLAADYVAKAPADGYTLLVATVGTHAINPSLYRRLPYDPVQDFTPVGLLANAPVAIVVPAASPVHTLAELVAQAKATPEKFAYGSAGNGTPGHLSGALFESVAGLKLTHVPYKGSAPALTDLLGGQIPLMFDPVQSVLPHIAAGKLRALAVTSRQRIAVLPGVPTVAESGYPGFETTAWWAVYAPARLPADVAARLAQEVERIARSAEFAQALGNLGVHPAPDGPAALAAYQKAEIGKWARAVHGAGVTLD